MGSKLEELRNLIAAGFEKAEGKEAVAQMTELKKKADEAAEEAANLEKEKKEILDDYKDVVLHGAKTKEKPTDPMAPKKSFEDFLSEYQEKKGKE